jgi:hypothetical protein
MQIPTVKSWEGERTAVGWKKGILLLMSRNRWVCVCRG